MSSSSTETLIDVPMPQMGVSVAEGTVVEWKKQVGDPVDVGEAIALISTDKVDADVEAPTSGRLEEILVEAEATVPVGTVLARISTTLEATELGVSDDGPAAMPPDDASGSRPERESGEAGAALHAPGGPGELQGDTAEGGSGTARESAPQVGGQRRRHYSPVAVRIAAEHGIDLDQVEGSGRGGRVRKQDVLAQIERGGGEQASAAPEPPMHIESPYRPEPPAALGRAPDSTPAAQTGPLSRMRRSIGERMLQSLRTAATCTTIVEVDMSAVEEARLQTGFTYLPYIARAAIETLREFPSLNATLEGDALTTYEGVHLGVAVSLGDGGLIVPVIHDAQDLTVEGLAGRIKELARLARANRLTPDDVQGGSFTITNPGGYGSLIATPVINQPQVAILDTEAVVKRPVVVTDRLGSDAIAIRPLSYLCMSWDHRALDGALAAQFLAALGRRLEQHVP